MLSILKGFNQKLYVVSAGVRAVVKESFNMLQSQIDWGNIWQAIELCMTEENFDSNNVIIGFQEPTILTTNKHKFVSHDKYPEISPGKNAIVMGDLIEDIQIVKDLQLGKVISIGFYNYSDDFQGKSLKSYTDAFDIVIVNDGNLEHIAQILLAIAGLPIDPYYESFGPSASFFANLLN